MNRTKNVESEPLEELAVSLGYSSLRQLYAEVRKKLARSIPDADDRNNAIQEMFYPLLSRKESAEPIRTVGLLITIARRRYCDFQRKKDEDLRLLGDLPFVVDQSPSPEEELMIEETLAAIPKTLEHLQSMGGTFLMKWMQGASWQELSDSERLTKYSLQHHVRQAKKELLKHPISDALREVTTILQRPDRPRRVKKHHQGILHRNIPT